MRVAEATAEGIRKVSEALSMPGGTDAANLEVAKMSIDQFGKLAKENNTMILPGNLTDIAQWSPRPCQPSSRPAVRRPRLVNHNLNQLIPVTGAKKRREDK